MRGWLSGIAAALAALAIATAAFARAGDETGATLGPLQAPPGGKAYRVTWDGDWAGYVEASVDAAGKVRMRRGPRDGPATELSLEPGDLAAFEQALARSPFAATAPHPFVARCVDDCAELFLTVAGDGAAKTLQVDAIHRTAEEAKTGRRSNGPVIMDAALELIELADARSSDRRGRPAPWWTPEWLERPSPPVPGAEPCAPTDAPCARAARAAWTSRLQGLGFQDLRGAAQGGETRAYRLVWFPAVGSAAAITVTREVAACGVMARRDPRCDDRVFVSTIARRRPHKVALADVDRVEEALYAAGFSTLAASSRTPCPSGDYWVLEAYAADRYRYVAGSSCDLRGLDAPVAQLRRWAR